MKFQAAAALFRQGAFREAEATCLQLLRENPDHPDTLHLLGLTLGQIHRYVEAIDLLNRAATLAPRDAAVRNNLGELYRQQDLPAEAAGCFEEAIALAPRFPEPYYNLGIAFKSLGRREDAMAAFRKAIELRGNYAGAHYNLANLLREEGRAQSACTHYQHALAARLDWADAHQNLGSTFYELGELDRAAEHLSRAQQLSPDNAEINITLGHVHSAAGRIDEASSYYQRSHTHAESCLERLRIGKLCKPIAPTAEYISAYQKHLLSLLPDAAPQCSPIDTGALGPSGAEPSVALAYHGGDVRPILEHFGRFFANRIPSQQPKLNHEIPRVGIVVTHGHEGVFARCWGGIAERLSRRRLELRLVCSRAGANVLRQLLKIDDPEYMIIPNEVDAASRQLQEASFDLLHYWEIGTDSMNYFLPFLRPAALQAGNWGWPVTSGNPHVTHFVSCEYLEPHQAQDHFCEALVQLKHLPTYYDKPHLTSKRSRESFGWSRKDHLYLCTQNLRKYHPDFDSVLAELLRGDSLGKVLIVSDAQPTITAQLLERFSRSMPDVLARIEVVPRKERPEYLNVLALADVMLDTLYYSAGANTVYDAFAVGTPIVTMPGAFQRGRWAQAAYAQAGIHGPICDSLVNYVHTACSIASDPDLRRRFSSEMTAAGDALFADGRTVREHEDFYLDAIETHRCSP